MCFWGIDGKNWYLGSCASPLSFIHLHLSQNAAGTRSSMGFNTVWFFDRLRNGFLWCYSSITTVGQGIIEVGQRERAQRAVDPEKLPERKLWKACQDIGEEGNWKLISRMGFADIPRWKDVSRMDKWQDNIVSLYFQDGRTIRIKILEVSTPLHYCSNLFPWGKVKNEVSISNFLIQTY